MRLVHCGHRENIPNSKEAIELALLFFNLNNTVLGPCKHKDLNSL